MPIQGSDIDRRRLLRFLAASPLIGSAAHAQGAGDDLIRDPREALNVFDFEPVMRRAVGPAHYGYVATGSDDELTLRANRDGFRRFVLRPRRMVDVSAVDMRARILGTAYDSPIVLAPTASNRALHAEGEIAVARAARAGNHLQILSTVATASIEATIEARGGPVWFQLYPTDRHDIGLALAKRAERAGSPVLVLTVDVLARQNWETFTRLRRTADPQACGACHGLSLRDFLRRKPHFDGLDTTGLSGTGSTTITWDLVKRLRDAVGMKIVLKGILAGEDAHLAAEAGVDGIILSNHGGRAEDNGRSTIEALPEILAAAGGRLPVLIDGGFRRGSDIVKAMALGAHAVCIGRPYLWGLGAFGQAGVERVLDILRRETRAAMEQLGAPTLKHLVPAMVQPS